MGVDLLYSSENITNFIYPFYKDNQRAYTIPDYTLGFIPYWTFEYHVGLKKDFGLLSAVNSEILIGQGAFEKSLNRLKPIDQICKQSKYELIDEFVLKPRIITESDAKSLIEYKLSRMITEDKVYVTKVNMYYLPYWHVTLYIDKKEFEFDVSALNEDDYKQKLGDFAKSKLVTVREKTSADMFDEALSDFFNIKNVVEIARDILDGIVYLITIMFSDKKYRIYLYAILFLLCLYIALKWW